MGHTFALSMSLGKRRASISSKYLLKGSFFDMECTSARLNLKILGHESAYVKVLRPSDKGKDVYDYDEIAETFRLRYMTAMEAYLRLVGYPIVSQSDPVVAMPQCPPGHQFLVFEEGHEGDESRILGHGTN